MWLRCSAWIGAAFEIVLAEIGKVGGSTIEGLAVHLGARVASAASGGEILVTSTVKDLVAGSGLRFTERGAHTLKGVPDVWHLYAVEG